MFPKAVVLILILFSIYLSVSFLAQNYAEISSNIQRTIGGIASTPTSVPMSFQEEFNFDWTYKLIFRTTDIPLPQSAVGGPNPRVVSIYSPSVVKFQGMYLMFFGVSIYCSPGGSDIARDSIALAKSSDGNNWQFVRYIIEPDPTTCFVSPSSWYSGATFEVNDPSAVSYDPNYLVVFYTSVIWPNDNFGNIGIAVFDKNLALVSRNDRYLVGTTVLGGNPGYSRPTVQWLSPTSTRLWFDSGGGLLGSVAITNLNQLNNAVVTPEGSAGGNADLAPLDYGTLFLTYDGIMVEQRDSSGVWSTPWRLLGSSGQGWDGAVLASPNLFLDPNSCQIKLYYAGSNAWPYYSIGMALPPPDKKFSFPACENIIATSTTTTTTTLPSTTTTTPTTSSTTSTTTTSSGCIAQGYCTDTSQCCPGLFCVNNECTSVSSTTSTPLTTSSTTTPQTSTISTTTTTNSITPPAQPCGTYNIPCWIGYFILRIFGLAK